VCLVVCFLLLVVCCLLANKDIYIYIYIIHILLIERDHHDISLHTAVQHHEAR